MSQEKEHEKQTDPNEGLTVVKQEDENKLLCDDYEKSLDIVESLYIPKNLGGRINFAKNQPTLAQRILGEELIKLDQEGAEDRKARMVLEKEAAIRHNEFIELVINLEKKAIVKNELQLDYIENTIKDLGREVALMFLHSRFVDRVFPPPPPEEEKVQEQSEVAEQQEQSEDSNKENLSEDKKKQGLLGRLKGKVKDLNKNTNDEETVSSSQEEPQEHIEDLQGTGVEESIEEIEEDQVESELEPQSEEMSVENMPQEDMPAESDEPSEEKRPEQGTPEEQIQEEPPASDESEAPPEQTPQEPESEEAKPEEPSIPKTFAPAMPESEEESEDSGPAPTPGIEISAPQIGGKPDVGGNDEEKKDD